MIRAVLLSLLLICHVPAWSQDCAGPTKLIAGLSAGGGMDALARLVAQRVNDRFQRQIIVENKVGAAGNIAAEFVAKAPKDGCTIIIRGNEHNVNPLIYARSGYEPADFSPIVLAVTGSGILVASTNQSFKTLAGMVAYAKANPGKLSYGSSGIGGANHVFAEAFLKAAKIDVLHVPYKGAAPAMADTVGGVLPLSLGSVASALPFIQSGKVIPLAVTGPKRWPTLPDVPTLAEAGYPDATMLYWMGFLAPAGTSAPVIDKLNQEFRAVLDEAPVKEKLLVAGYETVGGSPQDFRQFLQEDARASRRLMQELKLKVE